MTDNLIKGGADPQAWIAAFEVMTPIQRRWAFIAAKMSEHKQTFTSMAKRHRLTGWYLGACAQGKYNMAPSAVKALEADLHVDLSPFLSPVELRKCQRVQARMEEEV